MYKKILVPIDGSDTSLRGLREAIALAKVHHAMLRLLHVVDDYPLLLQATSEPHHFAQLRQRIREQGQALLEQARAQAAEAGVEAETALRESSAARVSQAITEDAAEAACDLIVIGTHGRRGLDRYLLGSNAEAVARTSPVGVLLVRGQDASRD